MTHKRKTHRVICVLISFLLFSLAGCSKKVVAADNGGLFLREEGVAVNGITYNSGDLKSPCLEVDVLDVGNSDAIFITFPDGKCMLIDCGEDNTKTANKIKTHVVDKGFSKIDYFILTHPDVDHIGNANFIINNFEIGLAFIPNVPRIQTFAKLESVVNNLTKSGVRAEYNKKLNAVLAKDYGFAFLSPGTLTEIDGVYQDFDVFNPTEIQINNISAVLYLECYGTRFVFTGDAGFSAENKILSDINSGWFENLNVIEGDKDARQLKVDLTNIDFLKVSHHGASDATGSEFLQKTFPRHAIISVGGNNIYGHPNSSVLLRLNEFTPNCKIWRTDIFCDVRIRVNNNATYKIYTKK